VSLLLLLLLLLLAVVVVVPLLAAPSCLCLCLRFLLAAATVQGLLRYEYGTSSRFFLPPPKAPGFPTGCCFL